MSQVLSFRVTVDDFPRSELSTFVAELRGSHQVEKLQEEAYEIRSQGGEISLLQFTREEVALEGSIDESLYLQFELLAQNLDASLLLEGLPLEEDEEPETGPIGMLGVFVAIAVGIFTFAFLVLALLLLPFRLIGAFLMDKIRKG